MRLLLILLFAPLTPALPGYTPAPTRFRLVPGSHPVAQPVQMRWIAPDGRTLIGLLTLNPNNTVDIPLNPSVPCNIAVGTSISALDGSAQLIRLRFATSVPCASRIGTVKQLPISRAPAPLFRFRLSPGRHSTRRAILMQWLGPDRSTRLGEAVLYPNDIIALPVPPSPGCSIPSPTYVLPATPPPNVMMRPVPLEFATQDPCASRQ